MSQKNVELVSRVYAEEGPFALPLSADAEEALLDRMFAEYYEEQFEVHMPPDYPEGEQVLVGRRGMAELIEMLRDSWMVFRFEPERFIDSGAQVTVFIRVIARGGASGLASEQETAHVWVVRHGRLASIRIYRDRAQALEAVGRSEG
jgi:ketosteroid isomerase-like protein